MEYQNGPSIIQVIKQNNAEKQAGKSEMYIFWTLLNFEVSAKETSARTSYALPTSLTMHKKH